MFKNFQSYLTPVLLGYVDKYIKDVKPQDVEVSLWGGSLSLHNLELRPDAIRDELDLPLSLSSGYVHHLTIRVPWIKILTEPIVVTIDTIECVLKLSDGGSRKPPPRPPPAPSPTPTPTYAHSLLNRILANVAFRCNNLILKYLDDDLVLSLNVKQFYLDNADGDWVPGFAEVTSHVRKLLTLNDLTLCLDRRNAAGNIDTYLEPLLYRCQLRLRTHVHYPDYTRIFVDSPRLEFNLSYQQIPMLLRIFALIKALKQNGSTKRISAHYSDAPEPPGVVSDHPDDSWSAWIWSLVDPYPLGEEDDGGGGGPRPSLSTNPNLLFSIQVDTVTFSFKIRELASDTSAAYTTQQRKVRHTDVCTLELNTVHCETSAHGLTRFCFRGGVRSLSLYPRYACPCGINDTGQTDERCSYFESVKGEPDPTAQWPVELDSETCVESMSDEDMLSVCPAFSVSYLYRLTLPHECADDFSVGSDLEFSNCKEDLLINVAIGASDIFICSGAIHRMSLLMSAINAYEYPPYFPPKPLTRPQDLSPPTTDDYDALTEHVPKVTVSVSFSRVKLHIFPWDHYAEVKPSNFDGSKMSSWNTRKISVVASEPVNAYYEKIRSLPSILLECKVVKLTKVDPMYPNRLTYVTCQLPDPPAIMSDACYSCLKVDIQDLRAFLVDSSEQPKSNMPFITECNFQVSLKFLYLEEYWTSQESIPLSDFNINIENTTVCVTMAKLYSLYHVIRSMFPPPDSSLEQIRSNGRLAKEHKTLFTTTLIDDTFKNDNTVHLDLNFEGISLRKVSLVNVQTYRVVVNAVKIFAIDSSVESSIKQVWILSAPESLTVSSIPFTKAVLQLSSNANYPSFFTLKMEECSFVMDQLLCRWLAYNYKQQMDIMDKISEAKGGTGTNLLQKRQSRRSLDELVSRIGGSSKTLNRLSLGQSSSDREKDFVHGNIQPNNPSNVDNTKERQNNPQSMSDTSGLNRIVSVLENYLKLRNVALYLETENILVYFPTKSVSAINFDSVQSAVTDAVIKCQQKSREVVLVLRLPAVLLKSLPLKQNLLSLCVYGLPAKLSTDVWDSGKQSYPWMVSLKWLSCYTLSCASESDIKQTPILKAMSTDMTISLTPKFAQTDKTDTTTKSSIGIENETAVCELPLRDPNQTGVGIQKTRDIKGLSVPVQSAPEIQNTKDTSLVSVGVCIHIDTEFFIISINHNQVNLLSSLCHSLREFLCVTFVSEIQPEESECGNEQYNTCQNNSLKKIIRYGSSNNDIRIDSLQEETLSSCDNENEETKNGKETKIIESLENKGVVVSTWLQWTISRITLKAYMPWNQKWLKMAFTADDVISSLDKRSEYFKWKTKVVTAGIYHFSRHKSSAAWVPGEFCGVILRGRENVKFPETQTENCFLFVNVTKAKCSSVHSKWKDTCKITPRVRSSSNDYISEVEISLQAIDIILNPDTLKPFMFLLSPWSNPVRCERSQNSCARELNSNNILNTWDSRKLPLCYFEASVVRIVASTIDSDDNSENLILQIDKISLSSNADNPVCRNPLRPDLYQEAARKGYLLIPGSELEDRQCQLSLKGIHLYTCKKNLMKNLFRVEVFRVKPSVGENPALEWNDSLSKLNSALPMMSILDKVDCCIIIALTMFYQSELICGPTFDLNVMSDIQLHLSTTQLKLIERMIEDFTTFSETIYECDAAPVCLYGDYTGRKSLSQPAGMFSSTHLIPVERGIRFEDVAENNPETSTQFSVSADTGIVSDITSDNGKSATNLTRKLHFQKKTTDKNPSKYFDVYVTFGKISLNLFENLESVGLGETYLTKALLYVTLVQPNFSYSSYHHTSKAQFSIFHTAASLGDDVSHEGVPKANDFLIRLFETKPGIPDSVSEISPNFLTVRWERSLAKKISTVINIKCPVRITTSLERIKSLKKIAQLFNSNDSKGMTCPLQVAPSDPLRNNLKYYLDTIDRIDLTTTQLVLALNIQDDIDFEILVSCLSLDNVTVFNSRQEKITNSGVMEALAVTLRKTDDRQSKVLIQPWSVGYEAKLIWDPWQMLEDAKSNPIRHLLIKTDKMLVEMSVEHVKTINGILNYCSKNYNLIQEVVFCEERHSEPFRKKAQGPPFWNVATPHNQHYKDDLRAGAFKFIRGGIGTPFPYQVFIGDRGLVWRYPQPRTITCIHTFPIPFQISNGKESDTSLKESVLCTLEYHSDVTDTFQHYTKFYIRQDERVKIDQLHMDHRTIFSTMWRIVMRSDQSDIAMQRIQNRMSLLDRSRFKMENDKRTTTSAPFSKDKEKAVFRINPEALAASLRIDSYFAPNLIPSLRIEMEMSMLEINFFNHYTPRSSEQLWETYEINGYFPLTYAFGSVIFQPLNLSLNSWNRDTSIVRLDSDIRLDVVNCNDMLLNKVVELKELSVVALLGQEFSDKYRLTVYGDNLNFNFGPHHLHAVRTSCEIWKASLNSIEPYMDSPITDSCSQCQTAKSDSILSKYFICNDTNLTLVFGQYDTDERISLEPRRCYPYFWKSCCSVSLLNVSIKLGSWKISKPFQIEKPGIETIQLTHEENLAPVFITVFVEDYSSIQKVVKFMGRLCFVNTLSCSIDLKIYEKKVLLLHGAPGSSVFTLDTKVRVGSMLMEVGSDTTARIHLSDSEAGWSGDVPLKECLRGNMPWLVKVPNQSNSQYVSVWCRVIKDITNNRTLVVLSPLYVIKSHLPMSIPIEIHSESFEDIYKDEISGQGSLHSLLCPGTTVTKHQIFLERVTSENPSEKRNIPLSYELINLQTFFTQKENSPDIDSIMKNIKQWCQQSNELEWPYLSPYDNSKWKAAEHQHNVDVTVRYFGAVHCVDSMIVDLTPWALLGNCSGVPISLYSQQDQQLCTLHHMEVLIPPSLIFKESFFCHVCDGDEWYKSQALTVSTAVLGPYEKKEHGCITLESSSVFSVVSSKNIHIFSVTYNIKENINVFKISSKYVFINQLPCVINLLPLALCEKSGNTIFPQNPSEMSITMCQNADSCAGTPINKFYLLNSTHDSPEREISHDSYVLYICLNMPPDKTYSCPIRVDKFLQRKSISVVTSDGKSLPVVLVCQENSGVVYITAFQDSVPQFLIKNKADMSIVVAQVLRESIVSDMYSFVSKDEILPHTIVQECWQSNWHCVIEPGTERYYSMPTQSTQYPEMFQGSSDTPTALSESLYLTFAFIQFNGEPKAWSLPVNVSTDSLEQFVKLPGYVGDIKVVVENHCHSTLILIKNVTQNDISASDIRQRLLSNIPCPVSIEKDEFVDYASEEVAFDNSFLTETLEEEHQSPKGEFKEDIMKKLQLNLVLSKVNVTMNDNTSDVASLIVDKFVISSTPQCGSSKILVSANDLQVDNPLFFNQVYDFQVVLVKQPGSEQKRPEGTSVVTDWKSSVMSNTDDVELLLDSLRRGSFLKCTVLFEIWDENSLLKSGLKELNLSMDPVSLYLEDTYVSTLMDYVTDFIESRASTVCCHIWDTRQSVSVPEYLVWEGMAVANPILLKTFQIEPLNVLLSVHSSMLFYLALDHSPLQFAKFVRVNMLTSSYRLGHALTMHYLSEAIFGAGWVVGSLEILGSPGGLARRVTAGLRDLVREPLFGLMRGPWGFIIGMSHGSVSLLKHLTQGTVESVSMVMGSVARNLDRLSLDQDHMRRTERARRHKPRGLIPAVVAGLQGLGLSLLGAIGGIAHEALIAGYEQRRGPAAVAAGLTRGLVGVITKPLSATADLLALTGQGLLHQAGWDQHPQPLWTPSEKESSVCRGENYRLKLGNTFVKSSLLFICQAKNKDSQADITLVLTNTWLILLDTFKYSVVEMDKLDKWKVIREDAKGGEVSLGVKSDSEAPTCQSSKVETDVQMDPALRARIAAYVGLVEDERAPDKIYRLSFSPAFLSRHCITMITFARSHALNEGFPVL